MDSETIEAYSFPKNGWRPTWTLVEPNAEQRQMIATIEQEFADDGKNRGINWIQGEMLDNREEPEIFAWGGTIGNFDRWQDVSDAMLGTFPCALSFIDDAGFRFYLPALMRWAIRWGLHYSAPVLEEAAERALKKPGVISRLTERQLAVLNKFNWVILPSHLQLLREPPHDAI